MIGVATIPKSRSRGASPVIRLSLIAFATGLLLWAVALAGAQTDTLGAPPELQAAAAQVERLICEGKCAEARAICQAAYDSATDDVVRALALRGIAESYKGEHAADQAIQTFEQVIARYPQSDQVPWAKVGIAECHAYYKADEGDAAGSVAKALAILEPLLKDNPNAGWLLRALGARGRCYERLGQNEAALADYLKGADLVPASRDSRDLLWRATQLQEILGRWDDMIASTERYIREMPAQETGVPPDAVVSLAHARFQLAEAYNGASRWADALAACEFAAADIDPVRDRSWAPPCLMLLADLQQHSQQWDNVITTARRYIDFYPNEIAAGGMITLIGDAYAQKGAAGSAMAEFDRVLSQYPTSRELCANAMLDKGLLQETLGQIGEARQTLEQVVRTYPGTYPAVKARQQLALMGQ